MNSNEKIRRLQKISRVTFVVLTVLQVLLAVAAVGVVLAGICYAETFAGMLNQLFSGVARELLTTGTLVFLILCVVVKLALYFAVLTLAGRMFRDFSREDSPFRQIHVRRMRWIALLIFVASFINLFSMQITSWIAALLIWCVSIVFDYGCQLQQESDETL